MKATDREVAMLLERSGLTPVETGGTRAKAAATGGIIARIYVGGEETPEIAITVDGVRAAAHLPVDEARVAMMVDRLADEKAVPTHSAFKHMLNHLLVKVAHMYATSEATSLALDAVHLHPNSYHIGDVALYHEHPLHLHPRKDSPGRDSTFTH